MYGGVLGLAFFLTTTFAPQPAGPAILWGVFAIQLGLFASICWRRTRLPFATAAMVIGALSCGLLAVLAFRGAAYPHLPAAWWPLVGAGMVAGPALLLVESRVNRVRWDQWRSSMQHTSVWDILRARHIPDLRGPEIPPKR